MNTKLLNRIIRDRIIDTARYRYIAVGKNSLTEQALVIKRLPIDQLDTTAAIDGWETVQEVRRDVPGSIRAAREAAGMTQTDLAKCIGTTQQMIYRYETGEQL